MHKCSPNFENSMEQNKTFCIIPWIHLHSWPSGKVLPCCISDSDKPVGNLIDSTIQEVINTDAYKEIRLKMLNGETVDSCKNCYNAEKYKSDSWRTVFNKEYHHVIDERIANTKDDGSIDPKLLYIDFRFSNFCNLECRTCGGELSSSIAGTVERPLDFKSKDQFQQLGIIDNNNIIAFTNVKKSFFNDDLKQYLEETDCFYFAGGEPLIQKEHFEILEYIHLKKWFDKKLRYSSNLSTLKYKNYDLVNYWKDFKNVSMYSSIDHFGDKLEYIRQNVNTKKVFENLDLLLKTHVKVGINSVVSIYNIYYLYDFFEFLDDNGYIDKLYSFDLLYAFGELHTPAVLPTFAKLELIDKLDRDNSSKLFQKLYKRFPHLENSIVGLKTYINDTNTQSFDQFIQFVDRLDNSYNKDINVVFPWLGKVITEYKKQ